MTIRSDMIVRHPAFGDADLRVLAVEDERALVASVRALDEERTAVTVQELVPVRERGE